MARIIGLKVAIPGMWCVTKAVAAIAPASDKPGNTTPAERISNRAASACAALRLARRDEIQWCRAIVIGVVPFGIAMAGAKAAPNRESGKGPCAVGTMDQ